MLMKTPVDVRQTHCTKIQPHLWNQYSKHFQGLFFIFKKKIINSDIKTSCWTLPSSLILIIEFFRHGARHTNMQNAKLFYTSENNKNLWIVLVFNFSFLPRAFLHRESLPLQFIEFALDIPLLMWDKIHIHIYFALN